MTMMKLKLKKKKKKKRQLCDIRVNNTPPRTLETLLDTGTQSPLFLRASGYVYLVRTAKHPRQANSPGGEIEFKFEGYLPHFKLWSPLINESVSSTQSNLLNLTDLGSVYDTVEVELGIVAAPSEERCMMPIRYVMRSRADATFLYFNRCSGTSRLRKLYKLEDSYGEDEVMQKELSDICNITSKEQLEENFKEVSQSDPSLQIVAGARVEVKFGKKWYKGQVTSITFSKKGQIDELKIKYEDGSEELCKYPDSNIRLLEGDDSEVKINHNKRSRDDDNDDEEEDDDDDDEIVKGIVVEVKFGSRWYKGEVFEIKRNKKGRVEEVRIRYKDGSEEKCELPDANIRVFRG